MAEAARAYTRVFIHPSGMACYRCVRFSSAPIPGANVAGASPCYRCVFVLARHRDDAAFRCVRRLGYHLQGVAEALPALHTQMHSTGSMHATAITGDGRWDSGVQRMR